MGSLVSRAVNVSHMDPACGFPQLSSGIALLPLHAFSFWSGEWVHNWRKQEYGKNMVSYKSQERSRTVPLEAGHSSSLHSISLLQIQNLRRGDVTGTGVEPS